MDRTARTAVTVDRSGPRTVARLGRRLRLSPVGTVLGLARRTARRLLSSAPALVAAAPFLARRRGVGVCLMYHRVHDRVGPGPEDWGNAGLSVHRDDLDRQLGWLARRCRCLALDEAVARLRDGTLPARTAIVTFDDGYRDNLELALPLLEKHGVPAAIFVATGLVDAGAEPWWIELERTVAAASELELELGGPPRRWRLASRSDRALAFDEIAEWSRSATPHSLERMLEGLRRAPGAAGGATPGETAAATGTEPAPGPRPAPGLFLSWQELAALAAHPLVTLGAHTVTHPALAVLPAADAGREIETSRRLLEQRTGEPVHHFAYPFGGAAQVARRDADLTAAAGLHSAFTTLEGYLHTEHAHHLFLLPRFAVSRRDGLAGLRYKVEGWPALLSRHAAGVVTL